MMTKLAPAFLLILAASNATADENFQLRILHTNDLHGMMLPFDYPGQEGSVPPESDVGGLARRATAIERIRSTTNSPVMVVDAGDIFTRGPWHGTFFGEPEIETMNRIGYDLMTVGNNEFKATSGTDSQEKMLSLVQRSHFPWLAANLSVTATGAPVEGIRSYTVKSFGKLNVCFLGLTAERVATYPQVEGWTVEDPIAVAKRVIPEARKHCELLIALTHIDAAGDVDERLASEVQGIDAIIGGDSHIFRVTPTVVQGPDQRTVPVAQAGELGTRIGQLDLTFAESNGQWRLKEFSGKLIPVDNTIPENPSIKQYLDSILNRDSTETESNPWTGILPQPIATIISSIAT